MDKSKLQNKKEWKKFGLGLAVILCFAGTLQLVFGKQYYLYFYFSAAVIFGASLIFPALIKPIFIIFSYLGAGLGWLTTKLILISAFYLLFTPVGLLQRIAGKDFLDLKFDKQSVSYWKKRKYGNQF